MSFYENKMNLKCGGKELTVYYCLHLVQNNGTCIFCRDEREQLLYRTTLEILEVVGPDGEQMPVTRGLKSSIRNAVMKRVSRFGILGCESHYIGILPLAL